MFLSYKYRLMPTRRQHLALSNILESQRIFYNAALNERIEAYRKTAKGVTFIDQCKSLTVCRREIEEMAGLPANLQRWTLKRLDEAYKGFFKRVKQTGRAAFPRYRGQGWWKSFGFAEFSGITFNGKRLRFKGLPGGLRVHLHRPLPVDSDIKSCVFSRDLKGWAVSFQVSVEDVEKRNFNKAIGIDLGLNVFAYCSDGVVIPNPRIAKRSEKALRRRQRALSRCKRGSKRRVKVKNSVARLHAKVANARTTWLHQCSAEMVKRADLIWVEDLRIANMLKNHHLARSIADVSWSRFISLLSYKAERAGVTVVLVDPKNTSQFCSGCGAKVPKSLAVRIHCCPHCNLTIDRDWNASLNVLEAAKKFVGLDSKDSGCTGSAAA